MRLGRRELLGRLAAIIAAPAVVEEGAVVRFFKSVKDKPLRYKGPVKIATSYKTITPIEWHRHEQSPEIKELILKKLKEDIDRMTKEMLRSFNENWYKPSDWVHRPQKVELDPPWLYSKFGGE